MASWGDVVAYVRAEYQVIAQDRDEIRILFEFDDDRSQVVVLAREVLDELHEWVQIASPCALVADVDLKQLLEEVGHTTVAGGAAIMGDHVVLRHSLPLENLDINELVDPMTLVAGSADELEEKFVGGDSY
ncbi:YbjN domain-containing protein [Solihabitans fulvus]|uniref:YbjN domain-containing protein n=1 Tax=Solihabitans fulvus TaxID=1892852 RepID=A0A5B2WJ90_9PSEU|nr:YbjN domain-containing protein [Solihabitans fulvus]KAA2250964.1 YbjN domain-containing protein [Solihabitans fulvus]